MTKVNQYAMQTDLYMYAMLITNNLCVLQSID